MKRQTIILTCEHAGNEVPAEFKDVFVGKEEVLKTHRGWDPGALDISKSLATHLNAPLFFATITRLLIEFNRSEHHEQLFSEFSKDLGESQKGTLLRKYHEYRSEVVDQIDRSLKANHQVVHFSIHTFTPELSGDVRNADIGILFDPSRNEEREFSEKLKDNLSTLLPYFTIPFNYPYLGTDDGFTTWLREKFTTNYIGIELEINQKYVGQPAMEDIKKMLSKGIRRLLVS